jgi:signal transduction histidine kinase/ligand-binding sensor domain-containing protein
MNNVAKYFFFTYCILSVFVSKKSFSQNDTLYFRHFSTAQGLSHNDVTSIVQDSLGFMWYGTQSGLNKFDGYGFVTYKHDPKNKNSLVSDDISCLSVEKSGIIWIGTKTKGVNKLDPYTGIFTSYQHKEGEANSLNDNYISCITADSTSGLICIGTISKGLSMFNSAKKTFKVYLHDERSPHSLSNDSITCIARNKDGKFWFGTNGGGVSVFDSEKETFTSFQHDAKKPNTISSDFIRDIFIDRKKNEAWMATADGLNLMNLETGYIKIFRHDDNDRFTLISNDLSSVFQDKFGKIWVGTKRNGLNAYYPSSGKFFLYSNETGEQNTLSSNRINTISQGRSGMFWAATQDGGLNAFNPKSMMFKFFNPRVNGKEIYDAIDAMVELEEGKLFFASRERGCFIYDEVNDEVTTSDELKSKLVYQVLNAGNNQLILATPSGLKWLEIISGKIQDIRFNEPVTFLLKGDNQVVWIGTEENGIFSFTLSDHGKAIKSYPDIRISSPVTFLMQDHVDQVWIGTEGDGVYVLNPKTGSFRSYRNNPSDVHSIGSNVINGISEDGNGVVWISTVSGGINAFRRSQNYFDCYSEQDGLPSNSIGGIQCDDHNNLWVGTDKGICRVSFDSTNQLQCRTYDFTDGLATEEFLNGITLQRNNGEIIFTCGKGFVVFCPDSIKKNPVKPPVIITNFLLFNKPVQQNDETGILTSSISVTKEIYLQHDQNAFSFEFTAMSFINAEKNQYKYMMSGFDRDWINTNAFNRFATYTNLAPGNYTFLVKASNNDGVWNQTPTELKIFIASPFYKTWWFMALLAACFALIIYTLHRSRISQVMKVQDVRNKIASDLHDDIGSGLSSISVFCEIFRQRTGNKASDVEPFLERIDMTSRSMSEAIHDIVWTINTNNDRFENVLTRMKSFASELLTAKGVKLIFDNRKEVSSERLTLEQRKNFYLLFKEAINNISKYAEAKAVTVSIVVEKHVFRMVISDDGKGFDVNIRNEGNGLVNMKRRAEDLGGKLVLVSSPGNGTILELDFKTT